MAKLTDAEKEICEKYSARDNEGKVHCNECPLVIDQYGHMCKANSTKREWEEHIAERFMRTK